MASLLASLKFSTSEKLNITHWSFNVLERDSRKNLQDKIESTNLDKFERIAISVFVWSESIVKELLKTTKFINYKGNIILGGRQISGKENNLVNDYPLCKVFVIGYGENSIKDAIYSNNNKAPVFLYGNCKKLNIPSPYLSNELIVKENQKMVRMETKRECPYSCGFCAHKDLNDNKIYEFPDDRIFSELDFFKVKKVKKINIIDPIFNIGNKYLSILEYIYNHKIDSQISIQVRFEEIKRGKGIKFIDICNKLNVVLEFGVQYLIENECKIIERKNDSNSIEKIIKIMNGKGINYEISLIYGLPEQSLKTFKDTIMYLQSMRCKKMKMYPLMLLKGTKLYEEKDRWGLKEEFFEYDIPLVIESNSFSRLEREEMRLIAEQSSNENYLGIKNFA
jgi:radical SAM superfamily enzyme YgiQ (UPF0313 family)